jgi:hypothetical protein
MPPRCFTGSLSLQLPLPFVHAFSSIVPSRAAGARRQRAAIRAELPPGRLANRAAAAGVARARARRCADRRARRAVAGEHSDPLAPVVRGGGVHRGGGPAVLQARRRGRRGNGGGDQGCAAGARARREHDHAAARRQHASGHHRPRRPLDLAQAPRAERGAGDGAPLRQVADPRSVSEPDPLRPRLVRHRGGGAPLFRNSRRAAVAHAGGDARRAPAGAGALRSGAPPRSRARAAESRALADGGAGLHLLRGCEGGEGGAGGHGAGRGNGGVRALHRRPRAPRGGARGHPRDERRLRHHDHGGRRATGIAPTPRARPGAATISRAPSSRSIRRTAMCSRSSAAGTTRSRDSTAR